MKSYHSLHKLVLLLYLSMARLTSAEDQPQPLNPSEPPVNATQPHPIQADPAQPGGIQQPQQLQSSPDPPQAPKMLKPSKPPHVQKLCKPTEVLTANKGCIDRDLYMQGVMERAWGDENLDEAKAKAGLASSIECGENEILTRFGCTPEKLPVRTNEHARMPIVPSLLLGKRVYKSGDNLPDTIYGVEAQGSNYPHAVTPISRVLRQQQSSIRQASESHKDEPSSYDRVIGHNRPRKYVYLPGRLLQTKRKCRPYEVLGRDDRCLRKKGKVGYYKHKDHKYGTQTRHRHEAFMEE